MTIISTTGGKNPLQEMGLHVLSSLEAQAVFKRVYKPLSLTVSFHFTTFSMHTNVHKNCASFVLFLFLQIV